MSIQPYTLEHMATNALNAASSWADAAIDGADLATEDARQIPAVILATTLAAALHYAASLHADAMSDLADAIRESGRMIAAEKESANNGQQ